MVVTVLLRGYPDGCPRRRAQAMGIGRHDRASVDLWRGGPWRPARSTRTMAAAFEESTVANIHLTMSCGDYDRTRPLIDGSVQPEGIDLTVIPLPTPERM